MSEISQLTARLIMLTARWKRHDRVVPNEAEVKEVGRLLNALGGVEAMQQAYYRACESNRAATYVSALWDGIGDDGKSGGWRW